MPPPFLTVTFTSMAGSCPEGSDSPTCLAADPPFGFGIRLGLVFIIEAAAMSLFSVLVLLSYIGVSLDPLDGGYRLNKFSCAVHHDQGERAAEVVCGHTRALVLLELAGLGGYSGYRYVFSLDLSSSQC